ncbi:MAG: D-alanyl-D-alanine carboxypeptidase family protein [Faecalibacillus intestinalis]|uniref:M15 family metallopeptidase n=1 Tax=Faecalibacillus intestinalis TaxID=1982626 RepID=UPI003996691D
MGLFKKKTDYSYYSSYSSSRRRLKVGRTVIAVIAAVVVILGIIIYFNFNRIQFLMKGYSWSTTSELVRSFDNDEEKELLSHDEMKHILKWVDNSNKVALYDEYEQFYSLHKDMNYEDIVDVVNYIFENQVPSLKSMGYSEKTIWSMLKDGAGKSDLQFLIDNKLTNSQTAPFRKVKGYDLKKINDYIAQYNTVKDYNYAVNIVNYPFIVSSNGQTKAKYNIANPDDYLTLVKKGFYLNDYEPKDLVELDSEYVAPTCDHPQLRKVAAEALVKMIKDAKKEGMYLLLNSGYRSYEEQEKIYQETEQKYGGAYAVEYVATPGASEHQTGLGIDMTSQSVVDKQRLVFGDTTEYKWVVENCAKYGFIVRFTEGTDGITGISHEPWHLRYVGKKVAKEIKDQNWTLEEYCLYKNVIPKFKKD